MQCLDNFLYLYFIYSSGYEHKTVVNQSNGQLDQNFYYL